MKWLSALLLRPSNPKPQRRSRPPASSRRCPFLEALEDRWLTTSTEFPTGMPANTFLGDITAGPDGNLWFTVSSGQIGRITPAGVVTEFPTFTNACISSITFGPDGNLWFPFSVTSSTTSAFSGGTATVTTENVYIGRITPTGTVTELPAGSATSTDSNPEFGFGGDSGSSISLGSITTGPDGNNLDTLVSGLGGSGGYGGSCGGAGNESD